MVEPFERADGESWIDANHEFETLLRAGKLLFWHDDLTEGQTERLNRITKRLGEICIERDEGGFR